MHNERCTSGSEGGPEKPLAARQGRRFGPTLLATGPFCLCLSDARAKDEICYALQAANRAVGPPVRVIERQLSLPMRLRPGIRTECGSHCPGARPLLWTGLRQCRRSDATPAPWPLRGRRSGLRSKDGGTGAVARDRSRRDRFGSHARALRCSADTGTPATFREFRH